VDVLPKALGGQFGATALLLPACLIAVGPLLLAADSFTVVTPPFGEPRTVAEPREGPRVCADVPGRESGHR
jgi:hypothetical protein